MARNFQVRHVLRPTELLGPDGYHLSESEILGNKLTSSRAAESIPYRDLTKIMRLSRKQKIMGWLTEFCSLVFLLNVCATAIFFVC